MGRHISARMIAPFSTVSPNGTPKTDSMIPFMRVSPMKPHTTEGIAASNSITIFNPSLSFGPQNSEIKMAAPNPKGTEISTAKQLTLAVPKISASIPYRGLEFEDGYHSGLVRNLIRSNPPSPKSKGAPSLKTKKKIPKTNRIALIPHRRIRFSMIHSATICLVVRLFLKF